MKKALILTFISSMLLVPALQGAKITAVQGPYSYSDGGEFTATIKGGPTFQTFCIEINNVFYPGNWYDFSLQQTAHPDANYPNGVPLFEGTAWLFSQFAAGTLSGYNFADTGGTRKISAGEFQAALWYFQDGQVNGNHAFDVFGNGLPTENAFTDLALSILGNDAYNPSDGMWGVSVIHCPAGQDWLKVPDGGATSFLLGLGLVALGCVRRSQK